MSRDNWDHVERIGLDDLLTPYEPADEPKPRNRPFPTWLVRSALFALVVSAGVWAVLRTLAIGVPFLLLLTLTLTISGLRRTLAAVAPPPLPILTAPRSSDEPGDAVLTDGLFLAVNRWDTRLSWTERDRAAFGSTILPRLAEIVDERLRLRHGVTRMSDPARARQLTGERLWALLHVPVGRYPTPQEFAAIVADMERL